MAASGQDSLSVHRAAPEDLPLIRSLREDSLVAPSARRARTAARARRPVLTSADAESDENLRRSFTAALLDPATAVLVARAHGPAADMPVVGFAWMRAGRAGALSAENVVTIDYLVVAHAFRRRGVGVRLLEAALSFAEQHEAVSISAWAHTTDRDANRYLARLGFAPLATLRNAPVPVLRRTVGQAVRLHPVRGRARAVSGLRRAGDARIGASR